MRTAANSDFADGNGDEWPLRADDSVVDVAMFVAAAAAVAVELAVKSMWLVVDCSRESCYSALEVG